MRSIIMAGGSGTRLWPFSRKNYPKQFLSLMGGESFLQLTAKRLSLFTRPEEIYVVTGDNYRLTVAGQLTETFNQKYDKLILEPSARNTAPAIALTMKYMLDREKADMDEVLFFSPSDHIIQPEKDLAEAVLSMEKEAGKNIVTFGIVPNKPDTGLGYIELGKSAGIGANRVAHFVEKPNFKKAEEYLKSGNFMWNSGMFMFSIGVMLEAFRQFAPELYQIVRKWSYDDVLKNYGEIQAISIDYAVMEKADNIICKKTNVSWNDIGSWDSIYEIYPKDAQNNAFIGDVESINVENSLVISQSKLIALIGVKNIAVIETPDAILVSDRKQTQDVKGIVTSLTQKNRKEATEHVTTYRPWGNYTVLEESENYKIKKIIVNPGERLSLQKHSKRSEHWVVVKGTALAQLGEQQIIVNENESAFIPKSSVHRLTNPGKIPLEIIEVQNGEYVGEDDIERLEDIYGRVL